ncbi:hypothetical protein NQ315_014112 [Exocentrus adspersus]|uniref:Endonuclease/exonuclease/phosphatase domain-containing protein n=1 Tax=Exocentrus adspersus TaxID=1586481 RepID=A0AAV8VV56_9CUCU|nr:hypothetical protein NQ315_014112 [Exocentrus adspersus]
MLGNIDLEDKIIILGDFNAKSPEWGAPTQDRREECLVEWAAALDFVSHNTGEPTFIRGDTRSHIDITFTTQSLASRISGWRVLDHEALSGHQHIIFNVQNISRVPRRQVSVVVFSKYSSCLINGMSFASSSSHP